MSQVNQTKEPGQNLALPLVVTQPPWAADMKAQLEHLSVDGAVQLDDALALLRNAEKASRYQHLFESAGSEPLPDRCVVDLTGVSPEGRSVILAWVMQQVSSGRTNSPQGEPSSAQVRKELAELAARAPYVTEAWVAEVADMPPMEMRRRLIRSYDWHGHFNRCLDGIKEIQALPGSGIDGCRQHKEVRAVVRGLLAQIEELKAKLSSTEPTELKEMKVTNAGTVEAVSATDTAAKPGPSMSRPQPGSFGKDHWSLLAYVETCCVDARDDVGQLDRSKMRGNSKTHPLLAGVTAGGGWKLDYSTRLAGFFDFVDRADPEKAIAAGLQLRDHDDWDCLDDLEAAGFLEVLSLAQCTVRRTSRGLQVAAALRKHKAEGGMYANFVWQEAAFEGA